MANQTVSPNPDADANQRRDVNQSPTAKRKSTVQPVIGRIVWFTPPAAEDWRIDTTQPLAAIIAYVHDAVLVERIVDVPVSQPVVVGNRADRRQSYVYEEQKVNLTVLLPDGKTIGVTDVLLLQDGDDEPDAGRSFAAFVSDAGAAKAMVDYADKAAAKAAAKPK